MKSTSSYAGAARIGIVATLVVVGASALGGCGSTQIGTDLQSGQRRHHGAVLEELRGPKFRAGDHRLASGDPRLHGGRQGSSSDVLFTNPDIQQYYIAIKPEVLDELRRRNKDLAIYDRSPVTAANEWPARPRPDLNRDRIGRVNTRDADRFIYYELEEDDRRGRTPRHRYYD